MANHKISEVYRQCLAQWFISVLMQRELKSYEREKLSGILKARIEGIAKEQRAAVFMIDVKDKGSSNEKWIEFAKWWEEGEGK